MVRSADVEKNAYCFAMEYKPGISFGTKFGMFQVNEIQFQCFASILTESAGKMQECAEF